MAGKNVVVTGANGYIASYLVKDLLERGYNVRGTVRNPDDVSKVGFLLALPGAKERLTLHKADLLAKGSFDSVVEGVDGVFHTASPFSTNPSDPQGELIDPAVKGTLNVLEAAERAKTVKRVVLTSSLATMIVNKQLSTATTAATAVDESWWSDPEFSRETGAWYELSKTLGEQAAWDFVKGKQFDLVSVNPSIVLGTMLQPTLNASVEFTVENYLSGENHTAPIQDRSQDGYIISASIKTPEAEKGAIKKCKNGVLSLVDNQDVSLAHILAYEKPEAEGRYLVVESVVHHRELAEILRKLYPAYPVATELAYEPSQETLPWTTNTEKVQKLGVKFTPLESQIVNTVTSLQQKGHLEIL